MIDKVFSCIFPSIGKVRSGFLSFLGTRRPTGGKTPQIYVKCLFLSIAFRLIFVVKSRDGLLREEKRQGRAALPGNSWLVAG
jgi:hypothetical protein